MSTVVVLGSFNMDLVVTVKSLPGPGETVLGNTFQRGPGGKGSNQAIGARRLGAEVSFIGAVGDDEFGAAAHRLYVHEGIDASGLAVVEQPTGVALIVVDAQAENQIAVAPGANLTLSAHTAQQHEAIIAEADVLISQLETPVEAFIEAARIARAHGTVVVLNPAPATELPEGAWEHIDILIPNQHELISLAGIENPEWAATALRNRGDIDVVVTRGPFGATWTGAHGSQRFPAVSANAVDTTGAGDAFSAGLAVGVAESGDIATGIALGLRAGAHAVTRVGVIDGLATREQLDAAFPEIAVP